MRRWLAPRMLAAHLALVLALLAVAWLSDWQLGAWRSERAREAKDVSAIKPVALDSVLAPDDTLKNDVVGRAVTVAGRWRPEVFFVSDRTNQGRRGFWVVSPITAASGSSVLVVRGWSAAADAPAMTGMANLEGWLQPGEGSRLQDRDPTDDIIPELRIASLIDRVPTDLYGAYVVTKQPTAELRPVAPADVPAVSQTTGLRNLLYGLQWWVFGAFAVYVWWRWCRDELLREASAEQ